jgi:uncharacterized protein with HEPN domain
MSRDPLLYLEDIVDACQTIREYIHNVSYGEFASDRMRFEATVRNLEVIGEASRQLPENIRNVISGVPWREIIGMRVVIAHAYHRLESATIWSTATEMVPPLGVAVRRYLDSHGD